MTVREALNSAMEEEMIRDDTVFIMYVRRALVNAEELACSLPLHCLVPTAYARRFTVRYRHRSTHPGERRSHSTTERTR